ncbi:MAG TPA: radical SAM protein [Microthrixaceae bacterium]|jgi:putative methyltransferase|nr:radical SAM protein [Microthrixaceae bacterium]
MSDHSKLAILICEPQGPTDEHQFDNARPYLPYMWATLKTYRERVCGGVQHTWLDPIWKHGDPIDLLEPLSGRTIDVLGLSCYTWNWRLQCAIAAEVKRLNPGCFVVVGGPEPDYKDPEFFHLNPAIDAIAVKDGEITFSAILDKLEVGERDMGDVPGLYVPDAEGRPASTGETIQPATFLFSPYVEQSAYYDSILAGLEPGSYDVILETNRGCPYGCSFCDWGSNTMSKIRKFEIDRVHADIDWISRHSVNIVMLADANFGILPRDVEIADALNQARSDAAGFPRHIFWSAAKNHPERVVSIAQRFAGSGISTVHALSIQHTRSEVLAATARSNISAERQVEVCRSMMEFGVPVEVQLILGIPGDTPDLWQSCLADLMEWGIHEDYLIQSYRLLPNAPAASAEFVDTWKVDTVERTMFDYLVRDESARINLLEKPDRIVVGCTSFGRADWIRMALWGAVVKGLHNTGFVQHIAVYLRLTHNVPYVDFYRQLIDGLMTTDPLLARLRAEINEHYERFLADPDMSDHMRLDSIGTFGYLLHPSRWLYVRVCQEVDDVFSRIGDWVESTFLLDSVARGLVEYQRQIIVLPSYDRERGHEFSVDVDWPSYFAAARGREGFDSLGEPAPTPGAVVRAADRRSSERVVRTDGPGEGYYGKPFDWDSLAGEERWIRWIEQTVMDRASSQLNNLCELRLLPELSA